MCVCFAIYVFVLSYLCSNLSSVISITLPRSVLRWNSAAVDTVIKLMSCGWYSLIAFLAKLLYTNSTTPMSFDWPLGSIITSAYVTSPTGCNGNSVVSITPFQISLVSRPTITANSSFTFS